MADLQIPPYALQWARLPDGKFSVSVIVQVPNKAGQIVSVPTMVFVLSKEEERLLQASLAGLDIASVLSINGAGAWR